MRHPNNHSSLPSPQGGTDCIFGSGSTCRGLLLICFALFSITGGRFSYVVEHAHGGHEADHTEHHLHGESHDLEHPEHDQESNEEGGNHHHHFVSTGAELRTMEMLVHLPLYWPTTLCSAEFLHDVGPDGPVFEITKPPQVA